MDLGVATHPGYVRSGNEDAYFASREHAVFAVADGMGGHEHGEVASRLALEAVEKQVSRINSACPINELPMLLHETVQAANNAIISQAAAQEARNRMGTTMVLATICGDRLYFAHIGDSRLYLLRGNLFSQLTRDHSLVQTMVDRGEITAEEAAIHPLRHQITRVVGGDDHISPEIASQALEPGDIILLCTDGLSGAVSSEEMKSILVSDQDAQEKADALVQAALQAGGPDNVTVVVVSYQRPRPIQAKSHARHPHRLPLWQSIIITVLSLAILLAGLAIWAYRHPVYYVTVDSNRLLVLQKRWPLLIMLKPATVVDKEQPMPPGVKLEEARPNLVEYQDVMQGIPMPGGKDAGIAFLLKIANDTASRLLADAKEGLEKGDLVQAQESLKRAKMLRADPNMVQQLEAQLARMKLNPPQLPMKK
ncbi:MAG: Stp1/IreP family PP2C-type Ser/Thr phosphatase [Armatimonadota bacterium]